jgi:hypothetical protein
MGKRTPPEGFFYGGEQLSPADAEFLGPGPDVLSAPSLDVLSSSYVFFTHGLLFTHAHFDRDPLADMVVESNGVIQPFELNFPDQIFDGLDNNWNARLLVVRREHWRFVHFYLSTISCIDRDRGLFYSVGFQQVLVPDGLRLAGSMLGDRPPMVEAFACVLSGNKRMVFFRKAAAPGRPPRVTVAPPRAKALRLGQALLNEVEYPFRAIEGVSGNESIDRPVA